MSLTDDIKDFALDLGYSKAGVTSADGFPEYAAELEARREMYAFYIDTPREPLKGAHPTSLMPTARSIITLVYDYAKESFPENLVGKIVGVQVETTGQYTAEEIEGITEIRKYETILLAFEDLELGRIDAIMNDFPVNAWLSNERGETKVVDTIQTDESYGISVKMGNDQLRTAINDALKDMMDDGTYDEIFDKWFGTEETTG